MSKEKLKNVPEGSVLQNAKGAAVSFLDEFRRFALKGNVVDLAVGVIIGAAFGKLVDSLVKNILMPVLSLLMPSEQSYLGWKIIIGEKEIPYGVFLGDVINFIIVAFAVFIFIVKFLGYLAKRRAEAVVVVPLAPSREEVLLAEIRDELRAQKPSPINVPARD